MRIGDMGLESYLDYGKEFGAYKKKYYWHRQCENCPFSWESRGYEGECDDWGCYAHTKDSQYFAHKNVCYMPRWIKRLIKKVKRWNE